MRCDKCGTDYQEKTEIIEDKPHELTPRPWVEMLVGAGLADSTVIDMARDYLLLHDVALAAKQYFGAQHHRHGDAFIVKALDACGLLEPRES